MDRQEPITYRLLGPMSSFCICFKLSFTLISFSFDRKAFIISNRGAVASASSRVKDDSIAGVCLPSSSSERALSTVAVFFKISSEASYIQKHLSLKRFTPNFVPFLPHFCVDSDFPFLKPLNFNSQRSND